MRKQYKQGVLLLLGIGMMLWFWREQSQNNKPIVEAPKQVEKSVVSTEEHSVEEIAEEETFLPAPFPEIPFYVQAPEAQWKDQVFQNACEEVSMLMVTDALLGKKRTIKEQTEAIQKVTEWQEQHIGTSVDTNTTDVAKTLNEYFSLTTLRTLEDITSEDIQNALENNEVVLLPTNGQKLRNTHFQAPGPTTHMVVVYKYEKKTDTFVVHDPGTKWGKAFRYSAKTLLEAAGNYPTGDHEAYQEPLPKSAIAVWKQK